MNKTTQELRAYLAALENPNQEHVDNALRVLDKADEYLEHAAMFIACAATVKGFWLFDKGDPDRTKRADEIKRELHEIIHK